MQAQTGLEIEIFVGKIVAVAEHRDAADQRQQQEPADLRGAGQDERVAGPGKIELGPGCRSQFARRSPPYSGIGEGTISPRRVRREWSARCHRLRQSRPGCGFPQYCRLPVSTSRILHPLPE